MTRTDPPTPTPEVQYLPTLFRRIRNGEIRVPAFQRGFVWSDKQVLELLESVLNGFPVGSLLLWKVEQKILKIEAQRETTFPDVDENFPLSYVLDGMQRRSPLYGLSNFEQDPEKRHRFNVIFDLEERRFLHYDPREQPRYYFRLADLFSPRRLISAQAYLSKQDSADALIEETISLHAVFQEYLIPTVTITHRNVAEVVQIFERVNSTGTNLGAVDFMRAVTWSEGFDLNEALSNIRIDMEEMGFMVPDETVVKILGIVLGKAPLPDVLLTLRECSEEQLKNAMTRTLSILRTCADLLAVCFGIQSYDYVPYEGQMLGFAKILLGREKLEGEEIEALRNWYWKTSFNEALQGRPDHYVARLVGRAEEIIAGKMSVRGTLDIGDFLNRSFIKGKALSSAMVSMFGSAKTRSLVTGQPIPTNLYMTDFSQRHFERLLPAAVLREFIPGLASNRVLANIVLMPEDDKRAMKARGFEDAVALIKRLSDDFGDEGAQEILNSQFIFGGAVESLKRGGYEEFLWERAEGLFQGADDLMDLVEG